VVRAVLRLLLRLGVRRLSLPGSGLCCNIFLRFAICLVVTPFTLLLMQLLAYTLFFNLRKQVIYPMLPISELKHQQEHDDSVKYDSNLFKRSTQ